MLYCLDMIQFKGNKVLSARTFGYFTNKKLKDLENIVVNNITDIWETIYKYAIIFKMPTNTLYADCYTSIYKAYKVVIPEPFNWDKVTYEEIKKESLPIEIKRMYSDLAIEEIIQEEENND